jgi:DNA-binding NtrC family response regulator
MRVPGSRTAAWNRATPRKRGLFWRLVDSATAQILREALQDNDWNRTRTARAMGLSRTHLRNLMRVLGVER